MNKSRKIIYSLLALPLVCAGVALVMLDSSTRSGFWDSYSRNLGRLFAGEWQVSELADPVRMPPERGRDRGGRRGRGYRSSAADVFAKLDRNADGALDASELGARMAAILGDTGKATAEEFQQSMWQQKPQGIAVPKIGEVSSGDAAGLSHAQLLDPEHVVTVDIQLSDQDWTTLCNQTRSHRTAVENPLAKPYTNFRGSVMVDGVLISDVAIRKKGFIGSQDTVRPSLKIKFDEFVEQTPVDGLDRLTLNNNRQDRALMSQSLTYYLFRKAGLPAPRSNFAAVTVNGQYLGIYTHVESVKKPFLSRAFGNDSGALYEGTLTDLYPEAIEWFERKTNKSQDNRDSLLRLATTLVDDSTTSAEIAESVDIDAFVKFWAIEILINFWDGYNQNQNNFFIYENPANELMYFIPWGADSCFANHRPHFVQRYGDVAQSVRATSILSNKLYHLDGVPEEYRVVMQTVLDEVWVEEELLAEMERIEALLLNHLDFQQVTSIVASDDIRRFIRGRRQIIQTELAESWPAEVANGPRIPMHTKTVGQASGKFYQDDEGVFHVEAGMTLDEEAIGLESIEIDDETILLVGADETNPQSILLNYKIPGVIQNSATVQVSGEFTTRGRRAIEARGHVTPVYNEQPTGQMIGGEFELQFVEIRGGFMDRRH